MDIAATGRHLVTALPTIQEQLMADTYRPSPARRVGIPKPDGSERELGIPTVIDRLIQQAWVWQGSARFTGRPYADIQAGLK